MEEESCSSGSGELGRGIDVHGGPPLQTAVQIGAVSALVCVLLAVSGSPCPRELGKFEFEFEAQKYYTSDNIHPKAL